MRNLVYISFLLSLFAACSHSPKDFRLLQAEKLMDEYPDSSLMLLREIDSTSIHRKADKALYSLLLSQALDKNYVDLTSDSIISTAVEFYSSGEDLRRNMLSQYYLGRIKFNAGDYSQSLVAMFKALDIAKELDDPFWIGMAARGLGYTYAETYNGAEELKYIKLEYESMKRAGKSFHAICGLMTLGKAYNNNGQYIEAREIAQSLVDSTAIQEKIYLLADVYRILGHSAIGLNDGKGAVDYLKKLCETGVATSEDSTLLGLGYVYSGEIEEAKRILTLIEYQSNRMKTEWLRSEILRRTNSYKEAFRALKTSDSLNNINFAKRINTDLSSAVVNHYSLLNMVNQEKLRTNRILTWLIVFISLAIILFIIIGLVMYRKKQATIIEKNILLAEDLRRIIHLKEDEYLAVKQSVRTLIASKFEIFDELCKAIYENPNSSIARKRISDMMERAVDDMIKNPKKIDDLEGYVNQHYSNLMGDFHKDFPNLKEVDYHLFLFSVLGFSINSISVLLGEPKITSIYNRKRRIKDRIKSSGIGNAERYLELL